MDHSDLAAAYAEAWYVVEDGADVTIRVGEESEALDKLLESNGASTWAFLTAYNPQSQPLPEDENLKHQAELIEQIEKHRHKYFRGYGAGEGWDPEPSIFILDIPRESAIELGRRFGQHAILWGSVNEPPELVWC